MTCVPMSDLHYAILTALFWAVFWAGVYIGRRSQ